jgi:hypothetical protein
MKSVETKFSEVVEALQKKALYKEFRAQFADFKETSTEVKLNCGLALLEKHGVVELTDGEGKWGLTFSEKGVFTETHRTINKNNGASDNFVEGSPFNEGRTPIRGRDSGPEILEADRLLVESLTHPTEKRKLTEAEKRKLLGQMPLECDDLTEAQKITYTKARMYGISEADALRLTQI